MILCFIKDVVISEVDDFASIERMIMMFVIAILVAIVKIVIGKYHKILLSSLQLSR